MLNRNEMGILTGDLDYGRGFPVEVMTEIIPILYPCGECQALMFHVVAKQHTGMGFKLPFARKPLAATGMAYFLICNDCTGISERLSKDHTAKLSNRTIPAEICLLYDSGTEPPRPYTEGYFEKIMLPFFANRDEDTKDYTRKCLAAYQREDAL